MVEDAEQARIEALEKRIEAAKAAHAPRPGPKTDGHSQAQMAWRMVIELVAGLMIGFGIGYGLDTLFGTMPIFLVLFILAGFAAGVKTMLRSAKEMQAKGLAQMDAAKAPPVVAEDEED
ncbi:MAG: AtpZ/AtpI family protein [Alphaproteobacteria bacterium]